MAAQAAAQAVASLAGQMARPAAPVGAEGADRAGRGGATPTLPVQMPIVASSSPPLLTSDESKSIMASTWGVEASVRKFLKCNAKVEKGHADLQIFAQDTTGTRCPAGIRPFRSAAEMVELESTLSQCKKRDWVFMVTIPVGTSRRSALQNCTVNMRCLSEARMWRRWKNSSRRCVVRHRWHISWKNAQRPCAKRGPNATTTLRDWIFLCVRKRPSAF